MFLEDQVDAGLFEAGDPAGFLHVTAGPAHQGGEVGALHLIDGLAPVVTEGNEPYIAVQWDVVDGVQPPDVTARILPKLEKSKAALPAGYRMETGGSVEESKKNCNDST